MKVKRIVYVIHSLDQAGGIERVTTTLAGELSTQPGFVVHIAVLHGMSSYFSISDSVTVHYLDEFGTGGNFKKGLQLVKLINELRPDIVVDISIRRLNLFLSTFSYFFKHKPVLHANEHIAFEHSSPFIRYLKKYFYRRFSTIAVLTEHDRKLMLREGIKNVIKIPNATSFFYTQVPRMNDRSRQVIAIGRMVDQKGFDRLLEIWAKLWHKHPDWRLVILGEGINKNALQQMISDFKIGNCTLMPFQKDVDKVLSESQIFAMTSRFEGLPMVLIEALSMGCALISYDCPTGPREIIRNNHNGFLIDDNNAEAFGNKLSEMMTNDELRQAFSQNALLDRFQFEKSNIISKWANLFS